MPESGVQTMTQTTSPHPAMDRTQAAVALDNLIRRHLRVGDPRDPSAVAAALRDRYTDDRAALEQEAAGLPFFKIARIERSAPDDNSTRSEERQAKGDVHQDLIAMTSNALLKDIHPELTGWSQTIRRAVDEGTAAARFALDPWQRDRGMAARRLLGDYARVARYVGALTPNLSIHYRHLAKSLDEVASVILVSMGDALASNGYGGGRFLLQAPASELAARRDAVIHALRNLVGTSQDAYGPNDWPRNLFAYRQVLDFLENNGLTDLRALLQENDVARTLDEVVHWATRGAAEDLRALGATALLALSRFRRLATLLSNQVHPNAPALAAYVTAVQLFVDAFRNAGAGYRLPYIARPPMSLYGLYGVGGPDAPTRRLLAVIQRRGELAQALDCYMGCGCGDDLAACQIMLDKLLYDTDRAIDLYALSPNESGDGPAEERAIAYGLIANAILCGAGAACGVQCPPNPLAGAVPAGLASANCDNRVARCTPVTCLDRQPSLIAIVRDIRDQLWHLEVTAVPSLPPCASLAAQPFDADALGRVREELCVQRDAEESWQHLLATMAPACRFQSDLLAPVTALLAAAASALPNTPNGVVACPTEFAIPRHFEESLDDMAR
jgi:hypothetical protein